MNPIQVLDNVRIVEYETGYAQAVADMWNASQESWGGGSRVRSAESVARELENAGNLKVFLAVEGNEVVGFCSFSHYKQDEGALYVPLLNVRPDYHGRRVGRSLILKALETTVEMGWPRLDLFTWAGNTKAVPMYKKCGFFWEKKDNSVHLMNFIPTVLQTEALQPYLERIDWYADSIRELEIRPDGRTENGFDYFEYVWAKDGTLLRVEFEKTGRGLRLIETDEYSIHTEIDDHDLVFGGRCKVRYVIHNKSGDPMVCTIQGRDDKNIRFGLNQTVQVHDTLVVQGEFQLDPVLEEQSDWKTHPTVTSDWTINGRRAEFRTGIAPKFPAKVKLEVKAQEQYIGVQEEAFLTFENNFKVAAEFEFMLPASGFINFENSRISIRIPAKGKATVPVSYILQNFGLYSEDVEIKAVPENGSPVTFVRKLHSIFKGNTGCFGGDSDDNWIAVNGPFTMTLNKRTNDLRISHFQEGNQTGWMFPRIGKPYSLEFSKKKAESANIFQDGTAMVLEAEYRSDDYPSLAFTAVVRLHVYGIIERYFKVRNVSGKTVQNGIYLIDAFFHDSNRLVLPYDGHYYDLEDQHASEYDDWETDRISENWLFSRDEKRSRGFCWHQAARLVRIEWHFGIEYELGRLAADETVHTPSTYLCIGTYADWWDFRSYAQKRKDPIRPLLRDHFELSVSDSNPFVDRAALLIVREHRNQPLAGSITLSSPSGVFDPIRKTYKQEEAVHSAEYSLSGMKSDRIESIRMNFEAEAVQFERSIALIPLSEEPVLQDVSEGAAGETYRCSNGPLSIAASPRFGAALHSLTYHGEEWLDSSFPKPGPRSWWNPWLGGISAAIEGMSQFSLQEEERSAEFVSITDNRGNEWSGISLHTYIGKHEKNRGMELSLFTLLLPGAPVLCCVTRLTNRTGLAYTNFRREISSFFHPGHSLDQGWMETKDNVRYKCGKAGTEIGSEGIIRFGSDNRSTILHAVNRHPGSNAWLYTNNLIINHGASQRGPIAVGETVWASPVFFAFAEDPLTYKEMRGLAEIRFDEKRR